MSSPARMPDLPPAKAMRAATHAASRPSWRSPIWPPPNDAAHRLYLGIGFIDYLESVVQVVQVVQVVAPTR